MALVRKFSLRRKYIMSCVALCVISLLACGAALLATTASTISGSVEEDTLFFLRESASNLKSKTQLLEDCILSIRNNDELMGSLKSGGALAPLDGQFKKCVDLYSDKNMELPAPFIEKAYLFSNGGEYVKSFYYAALAHEEQASDKIYLSLCEDFNASGGDLRCYASQSGFDLATTLYDRNMDGVGTLIFSVSKEALKGVLEQTEKYDGAFWYVCDSQKSALMSGGKVPGESDMAAMLSQGRREPFIYSALGADYIAYTHPLCLGVYLGLAIPVNHVNGLVYSSVETYLYLLLAVVPIIIAVAFIITYKLTNPLKEVTKKIKLVGQGNFETKMPDFPSREFEEISQVFNQMTDRINYLLNDVYQKETIIARSELKLLQTQMDPHFLFNVLNAMALKAKMDGSDQVYDMACSLAQLMQSRLLKSGNDKIRLSEEMDYVRFYLNLQKARFGDRLRIAIAIEGDELLEARIPKLTIQPIVENAVIHGLEPKPGKGRLEIAIYNHEDTLTIDVADDGVGFDAAGLSGGPGGRYAQGQAAKPGAGGNRIGIYNADRIIKYYYGKQYGIDIISKKGEGTRARITMPYERGPGKESLCIKS